MRNAVSVQLRIPRKTLIDKIGLGGNDSITGNFNTHAIYTTASVGVTVTLLSAGTDMRTSITP